MTYRLLAAVVVPISFLSLSACSDQFNEPLIPISVDHAISLNVPEVPPRSQDSPGGFVEMPDEVLWNYIAFSEGIAVVGLKRPGVNRGVWQGQLLLNRSQWREARHAVTSQKGIKLISADTLLPTIIVKIDGIAALHAIRKLPIVDYVQPETVDSGLGGIWADSGGCDYGSLWTNATPTSSGDLLSASAREMGIEDAWRRSNGDDVTIALIDTGIADTQSEIADWATFKSGESGGRTIDYLYTNNTGTPWSAHMEQKWLE